MANTRYQFGARVVPWRALPGAALRAVVREGYGWKDLKGDVLAGMVVGVVALPLAMALAIAVGVAPQYGLYTTIVAGFVVALLGGSRTQVTGPTAAFIVILAPIYGKFGMSGLLLCGLMGGLILIALGLGRLGRFIEFIPHPVTTGFTSGIAIVLATLQLKDLLGLRLANNADHFVERLEAMWEARGTASPWEAAIGVGTLAILLSVPRFTRRVPAPLIALPAAALAALALGRLFPAAHLATIANSFHTTIGGNVADGIPQLPPLPLLPWLMPGPGGVPLSLGIVTIKALMSGALAVAMLGAIESLLSAVVADGMARTRHDPDAELLALGIGNVVAPFFGGIPATGAIARTATNVRSGGRSPVASMVHAATVLAAVLLLAPVLGYVPMASLAALLCLVAWNMSEVKHFIHTLKVAPGSDVTVLLTCFGLTVTFDMVVGVSVGMVIAAMLFMRRMAEVTESRVTEGTHPDLPGKPPRGVVVYEISGPLFFGAAQKAMAALGAIADRSKVVILLMDEVNAMDVTGLVALESALDELKKHHCLAILSGVRSQPRELMRRASVDGREGVLVCASASEAFAAASKHVGEPTSKSTGQVGPVAHAT